MNRALVVIVASKLALGLTLMLGSSTPAHAKIPKGFSNRMSSPPPVQVLARPAPPLPMLPQVARVRIEAARDRVILVEDVSLPRGEWQSGGLDLYVAFGAPGAPIAIDARLVAATPSSPDSHAEEGVPVVLERAVRRTQASQLLLGKGQMAGVIARIKDDQLRHAYAAGDTATLRLRSLLAPPAADATGEHEVVVRLGVAGGLPLTLGHIQLASLEPHPWITRAEATLCGPEADAWPLTITPSGKTAASPVALASAPIPPEFAVRHASDDLCVRWWAPP